MAEKINYAKTVRAAKKGDLNAYQDLYDSTINDVAAICKKLLNSSTDPDSVIEDTYLTLFQSLESMKTPKAFASYAAEAAATQCYNANQLRPAVPADLGAPQTALDVTEDALNALNNGQRTALLLQNHGMTNAQIADVMGVTEYTVNSDVYFGRKKLQKAVAAHRDTISFDEYGVGNDVLDPLLDAYSDALYETIPQDTRAKQFKRIINILEGNAQPAHVDEPIAPEVTVSPKEEETIVEEPKAEAPFFVAPKREEPAKVTSPSANEQNKFTTTAPAPKKPAPKKSYSVPKQTTAVSRDSGNSKKVLLTVLIVLVVAVIAILIIVFASRNNAVEETTTVPYTSSYTVEETTESTTQAVTRRTQPRTTTEAQTEEATEAPTEAPTQAPVESGGSGGETE